MLNKCLSCGGELSFSPKDKGNRCANCHTLYPVPYKYGFNKKSFKDKVVQDIDIEEDELLADLKSVKCQACGANIMLTKLHKQTTCPYCGSDTLVDSKVKNLMYIDSIIPFTFDKAEAFRRFKKTLKHNIFVNKKYFKHLTIDNFNGVYINSFVFDLVTSTNYFGTFSFEKFVKDMDGNEVNRTFYENVRGVFEKEYENLTIEANENIEQKDLVQILPYEFASAVSFRDEFLCGYMLEFRDKSFSNCEEQADHYFKDELRLDLLKKHNCDRIENLQLDVQYLDKKYNYCLLPVYTITNVVDDKEFTVFMNGQTGKTTDLPSTMARFLWLMFGSCLLLVGAIVLFVLLT